MHQAKHSVSDWINYFRITTFIRIILFSVDIPTTGRKQRTLRRRLIAEPSRQWHSTRCNLTRGQQIVVWHQQVQLFANGSNWLYWNKRLSAVDQLKLLRLNYSYSNEEIGARQMVNVIFTRNFIECDAWCQHHVEQLQLVLLYFTQIRLKWSLYIICTCNYLSRWFVHRIRQLLFVSRPVLSCWGDFR